MNMQCQDKTAHYSENEYISILRALAIFSVVCAHVTDTSSGVMNLILSSLGTYGVGLFFIMSGYFFFRDKKLPQEFIKRKLITIIIPWFFCGTLDWLYVVLRKGGLTFENWISFILIHSHYYYLSVLIICYAIMWCAKKRKCLCYAICMMSMISIWLTGKGLLQIYPYSNPLNWIGYFIIGIEMARYNCMERLAALTQGLLPWTSLLSVFSIAWLLYDRIALSYWYHGNVVVILLLILVCFGIGKSICNRDIQTSKIRKGLIWIGNVSYTIYLIHMPFAGVIKHFADLTGIAFIQIALPLIVLGFVCAILYVITVIPLPTKVHHILNVVLGIRK